MLPYISFHQHVTLGATSRTTGPVIRVVGATSHNRENCCHSVESFMQLSVVAKHFFNHHLGNPAQDLHRFPSRIHNSHRNSVTVSVHHILTGHYGTAEARGCRLQTPLTPLRTPLRNICNQCAVTRISPSVKNISRILISHFSNENTIVGAVKMAMYCLDFKDFKMSWKLLGIVCASTALRVTPGNDAIVWPRNITRITNKRSKGIRRSKNFDDILQFGWILSTKALPPRYNGTIFFDGDTGESRAKDGPEIREIDAARVAEGLRISETKSGAVRSQHSTCGVPQLDLLCADNLRLQWHTLFVVAPNHSRGIRFPSNETTVKNASSFETKHSALQVRTHGAGIATELWMPPRQDRAVFSQSCKGRKTSKYFYHRVIPIIDFFEQISIPCVDRSILLDTSESF
mmetsp:Transcript_45407/g.98845  ORF Transcript_45407/g.98845 Transcript_45407/m.98845 type:complete len:402 (-) Transcript_45407:40-1245(-)